MGEIYKTLKSNGIEIKAFKKMHSFKSYLNFEYELEHILFFIAEPYIVFLSELSNPWDITSDYLL